MTKPAPRDYPNDLKHENANYFNRCAKCKKEFKGHKRRAQCKVCEEAMFNRLLKPKHGLSISLQVEDGGLRLSVHRYGKWRNLKVGPFGIDGNYGIDEVYTTPDAFKALGDASNKSRREILAAINWQGAYPFIEWLKWRLKMLKFADLEG